MSVATAPGVHATTHNLDDFLKTRRASADAQSTNTDQPNPEKASVSDAAGAADTSKGDAAEANPGKKEKTAAELKVELSNQAKANLRLGKERAELQREVESMKAQMDELKARAEGTYVEPTEDQKQKEAVLRAEFEKFEQRREQSKEAAIKEFGEEYVLSAIYQDESPFTTIAKAQPWVTQRIMSADQPVLEAIKVVHEQDVLTKFGRTEAEVLAKAETILRPKLFAAFTKEIETKESEGVKPPPRTANLSQVRSAGADSRAGSEPVRTFSALNLNPHNRV